MDFEEFKINSLGIDKNKFGRIYSFIDFGNVNYWYEKDRLNCGGKLLLKNEKNVIDIGKVAKFAREFSICRRFYFGIDLQNKKSIKIISKARKFFDKTVTKPIQHIKHYINNQEERITTRNINSDRRGKYITIPKCNFDAEICVDAVRFLDKYDTFCLFSGDADFAYLCRFLKRNRKKIIIFSSGYVSYSLKREADLNINSQRIKADISFVKDYDKNRTPPV